MKVRVYHNGDDVFIAWKPDGVIAGCRGFALLRRRNGVEEVVSTWVGFEDDKATEGERRASTNWPIQKYQWTDYMANPGDRLAYRVLAMVGPDKANLHPDPDASSDWTPEVTLSHTQSRGVEVLFNRGIVASQWVSRRLGVTGHDLQNAKLETVIATPGDGLRNYLAGPLGDRLFALLDGAVKKRQPVYAALYELDDPQLIDALTKLGQRAHVVLANGSVERKGEDQNADARKTLADHVDLHNRMCSPRALGHNKFLVICERDGTPRWVWTGSQNWTMTGLCTQANNSVLIDNRALAAEYRAQWDQLRDAGDATPAARARATRSPANEPVETGFGSGCGSPRPPARSTSTTRARSSRRAARDPVPDVQPGPRDTLLNTIIETSRVARTPARGSTSGAWSTRTPAPRPTRSACSTSRTAKTPTTTWCCPAAIDKPTEFFRAELKKLDRAFAMVHSKVIIVDPFGDRPGRCSPARTTSARKPAARTTRTC